MQEYQEFLEEILIDDGGAGGNRGGTALGGHLEMGVRLRGHAVAGLVHRAHRLAGLGHMRAGKPSSAPDT